MPVNITQYRGPVGIFNNRNFVFLSKFTNFIDHKCWNTNHLYLKQHLLIFLTNLAFFSRFCNCSSFTKVQFLYDFKKHLPVNAGYYNCFTIRLSIYFCYVVIFNSAQDPNRILKKKFISAAGTLIA